MEIRTAYLTGPSLDWAVATVEGRTEIRIFGRTRSSDRGWIEVRFNPEPKATTARFDPSENWAQGGLIIEREKISVEIKPHGYWMGSFQYNYADEKEFLTLGPTPLIAAMRCYVESKMGEFVEIPDELCK